MWFMTFILVALVGSGAMTSPYYDPEKCGIPVVESIKHTPRKFASSRNHKVMGGESVPFGAMPWAVALFKNGRYFCSGTLISRKHVITAAHCFSKDGINEECGPHMALPLREIVQTFTVGYSSNCLDRTDSKNCIHSPVMKTSKIVRAELGAFYERGCASFDIALVEMADEIDENANYICLPHRLIDPSLKISNIYVYGWGSNPVSGNEYMNVLQAISIPALYPQRLCAMKRRNLQPDQICIYDIIRKSVCFGDSGGGLISTNTEGRWILHGVISYGSKCSELLHPRAALSTQVLSHVPYYALTIDRFTKQLVPWVVVQ